LHFWAGYRKCMKLLELLKLLEAIGLDSSFPISQSIRDLDLWFKSYRCLKISALLWIGSQPLAMQQNLPMLSILGGIREVWATGLGRIEGIHSMGFLYATVFPPSYWFDKWLVTLHYGLHMTNPLWVYQQCTRH
jgi:hypothetical protein